jgi:hypothetical protein
MWVVSECRNVDTCVLAKVSRHWWLTPVILVTQEAEIRRAKVQSQPRQIVLETLFRKNPP